MTWSVSQAHYADMPTESPRSPDDVLRELGIEPDFADDTIAPPPDKNRLRQLRDNELDQYSRIEILDCVSAFRPWYQAFLEVLTEPGTSDQREA